MESIRLDTIPEALTALQKGEIIIVVDDEDRENEGDFVCVAEHATPEVVNFMARYGRGLICTPLTEAHAQRLKLEMMVPSNTSLHETPFTVSVDLLGHGCTTGISAADRSKTIQALTNETFTAADFGRPGHIFPLKSKPGGVLRRAGHTEATTDLCLLAGYKPCGVLVEILNEDGTMARLPQLIEISKQFQLKIISIKDLIAYRLTKEQLVERRTRVNLPTRWGTFELINYFVPMTQEEHLAIVKGEWTSEEAVLVRMHSSCMTGDIFGSCRCDCGDQLQHALMEIEKKGQGVLVYLNQEGRGIGLSNKLKAYALQEQGRDTVEANLELGFKADERDYGIGAHILRDLGIQKINLMTNNPKKRAGLEGYNLEIVSHVPLRTQPNPHNSKYLETKKNKLGHLF